jgi:hypothetical protein
MNERTAEDRLRYAKGFSNILENGDASKLLQLPPNKRLHVMKSLSSLSRFLGCYDTFLQLRQRYGLKWSTGTENLDVFERFFDDSKSLDTMLQQLKEAMQALPKVYRDIFLFSTLTGLRISECLNCIRLIKDPETFKTYYSQERMCLQHYMFPKIFIRRTKAAYITIADKEMLQIAQNIAKTPHTTP